MQDLAPIFSPRTIAIVGASARPGSVGSEVMNSILRFGYTGSVFPINPNAHEINGLRAYQSIVDVPDPVDLALIVVKRDLVLETMEQCVHRGVRGVIVITAGFKEVGGDGIELERRIVETARGAGVPLVGPNCMGVFNTDPLVKLNATFARRTPWPGRIGFVSQSGAVGAAVLDYSSERRIGFSKFLSIGNKGDVNENDALYWLAGDDEVAAVMLYLENFEDAAAFREICAQVAGRKPVVVLKAGRGEAGARAASSHTGALAGSDAAVDALLESCGAIRVQTLDELMNVSKFLCFPRRPGGRRLALITNAGGPGILTTDELEKQDFVFPELEEETVSKLEAGLPPEATCANPCDVLPGTGAEGYRVATEAIVGDGNIDALVVLFLPPIMVETRDVVEAILPACRRSPIPVIGLFMGASDVPAEAASFEEAGFPVFNSAPEVTQVLAAARRYRGWHERKPESGREIHVDEERADSLLNSVGDGWLGAEEAFGVLEAYGIPVVRSVRVAVDSDLAPAASELKFPLVLKAVSSDILHKSDVGGVELGIENAGELAARKAHMIKRLGEEAPGARLEGFLLQEMAPAGTELIVGLKREAGFGPLVMCGLGGVFVEVLEDVSFGLAPLPVGEAKRLLERLRSSRVLAGERGSAKADIGAVADVISRVALMGVNHVHLAQLDINPLVAGPWGCVAVDTRILIQGE